MKKVLCKVGKTDIERLNGFWSVFEKFGSELGESIGKGIDWAFKVIEQKFNN